MTFRRVAPSLCAAALLVPAPAGARPLPATAAVEFGAGVVRGYDLQVRAVTADRSASLTVVLTRRGGTSAQRHVLVFDSARRRPRFTVARALRSTRLRADLGPWGRIDVTFAGTGAVRSVASRPFGAGLDGASLLDERRGPVRCTAAAAGAGARVRSAKVTGLLRLTLDDTYFRTITRRRLGAGTMIREPARTCPGPRSPRVTRLVQQGGDWTLVVERGSSVLQDVQRQTLRRAPGRAGGARGDVAILDEVLETGIAPSAFTVAPDGSSATVAGAGPFLTGSLGYAPVAAGVPVGEVRGDYAVRFDGGPAIAPYAAGSGPATLAVVGP
jgi:hypothetical protein